MNELIEFILNRFAFNEVKPQVRIAKADNTGQYWPNLGSQQSANVIEPVSPFASVKCWADDGSFCRLFKFTDLLPKLGPVSALYQADCHFHYGPFLCRKQVLVTRVWARIGRQMHTGVIITATARYWQPIFGNIFADAGPLLGHI